VCCSVLQCVAVCCSVLQCGDVSRLCTCYVWLGLYTIQRDLVGCEWTSIPHIQPIIFGVSFNLTVQSQSPWSLCDGTWKKRIRELEHRLWFNIEAITLQMQYWVDVDCWNGNCTFTICCSGIIEFSLNICRLKTSTPQTPMCPKCARGGTPHDSIYDACEPKN